MTEDVVARAKERLAELDAGMERARAVSRDAIYRVTLLSASIVAFSATLLSIEQIDLQGDQTLLAVSWCLFAGVVVVGPASLALEARAQYLVAWRSIQQQDFDAERKPTLTEGLKLAAVLAYSVAVRPRNLIYCRLSDYSEGKPTQGMWMNFRMVLLAHKVWDVALALEVLVWVLFSAAVVVLLVAIFP
jgi:hypothetical protein